MEIVGKLHKNTFVGILENMEVKNKRFVPPENL